MSDDTKPLSAGVYEKTDRDLLVEVHRDVSSIRQDMDVVKVTLFGKEDRLGLVGRVTALEKDLATLTSILKWLALTMGGLVATLLWAIFTGQVRLQFP